MYGVTMIVLRMYSESKMPSEAMAFQSNIVNIAVHCVCGYSYLNAIQTMCPHILRYLATAVIINRPRRSALKDLVKVIQQVCVTTLSSVW